MKNLKKIFAIAMSVATVAMSTSAFADEIAAAYDAENKVVAFTEEDAATILNGIDSDDQMTVVVVPSNFGETDNDADKIYYINQDAASGFATIITAMGVKDGFETEDIGDATWQVRIGGESITATPYAVKFEEEGPVITIVYGDADKSGTVTTADASRILQYLAEWEVEFDEVAADADGSGAVTTADASRVLQYLAEWDVTLGPVAQ